MATTADIKRRIAEIDKTLAECLRDGVSSESISTPNGGSVSKSYLAPAALRAERAALLRELDSVNRNGAAARCYYPFGGG